MFAVPDRLIDTKTGVEESPATVPINAFLCSTGRITASFVATLVLPTKFDEMMVTLHFPPLGEVFTVLARLKAFSSLQERRPPPVATDR